MYPPESPTGEEKQLESGTPGRPQGWIQVSPMSVVAQLLAPQPWRITYSEPSW